MTTWDRSAFERAIQAVRKHARLRFCWLVVLAAAGSVCGCGSSSKPGGTPDFSLSASPTSVTLTAGSTAQTVSVSATAILGFSQSIQVTGNGLPAGVTASPSTFTLAP